MDMKKRFAKLFSSNIEVGKDFSVEDVIQFWDGVLSVYHFNDDGRIAFVNNNSVGVTLFDENGNLRWTTMDDEKVDVLCLGTSSLHDGVSLEEFVRKNKTSIENNKYYERCKSFVLEGVGKQVFAFYNELANCVAFSGTPDPDIEDCTLLFIDKNSGDYVELSCEDSDNGYFIGRMEIDGVAASFYMDGDMKWKDENGKVTIFQ